MHALGGPPRAWPWGFSSPGGAWPALSRRYSLFFTLIFSLAWPDGVSAPVRSDRREGSQSPVRICGKQGVRARLQRAFRVVVRRRFVSEVPRQIIRPGGESKR
jgi:hypothetical protein